MVKLTDFPNGFKLVTEKFEGSRSSVISYHIGTGSGMETEMNNGISHFTEHMMFKGTKRHDSIEISKLFEDCGSVNNAYTGKEATCYYVKCIDEYFYKCLDIMTEILFESVFPEEELNKEREVISEEYNMSFDEPDDILSDILAEKAFEGNALARKIIGTKENIARFTPYDIKEYLKEKYGSNNIVLSICGNVDHDEMVDYVEKHVLAKCLPKLKSKENIFPASADPKGGFISYEKDFQQASVAISFPALPYYHEDMHKLALICNALGGGMSSRLFRAMRENKGLVYNVYSSVSSYKNNGTFEVDFNTSGSKLEEAISEAGRCLHEIFDDGISEEEFKRQLVNAKSSLIFGRENIMSVALLNGKYATYFGKPFDIDKHLEGYTRLSLDEINAFAKSLFDPGRISVAYVGDSRHIKNLDLLSIAKSGR
ncbi:MAG: insulinase family protein [Clostridia bacterium]|nr:insulinase family protein [Clostridia bacterium]